MTTYAFKELCNGPRWRVIKGDFARLSQAEAFAIDWFAARQFEIVDRERDKTSIDFMTARGAALYQYAIEVE